MADRSTMLTIVSGNTNAAAITIGEKASDLIKKIRNRPRPDPRSRMPAELRPRQRRLSESISSACPSIISTERDPLEVLADITE